MIPAGYLVHQTFGIQPAVAATILPALAAALYLAANHLSALPRQRPWDGRLQAACVGASAILLAPLFLLVSG
jgi:chromate transport protein ChrA